MVKIGITDLGEPCFDTSWIDKVGTVDGLVLVSRPFRAFPQQAS